MRLGRKIIDHVARTVTQSLLEKELITSTVPAETLQADIARLITDDLMVEDQLNAEVKDILRTHATELERGNIDYNQMFTMIKRRLVRERGLIL